MIIFKTNLGDIKIELDFDNAPNTAKNFQQYVEKCSRIYITGRIKLQNRDFLDMLYLD